MINFGCLRVFTKGSWVDTTGEVEGSEVPLTLTKPHGTGALQFSAAQYMGGKGPSVTLDHLKALCRDFATRRNLGKGVDAKTLVRPILVYAESFDLNDDFIRVWYCSDGSNVALVTYVSANGVQRDELLECEEMVQALQFSSHN